MIRSLFRNSERVALDGKTYSHDLMTTEALAFIEMNKGGPFYLYLPYCIPHTKFQVPELGEYDGTDWTKNQKTQAAMITRMDRDVGRIREKLEELGIDGNTLLMFTNDHGAHGDGGTLEFFKASGPLRGIKRSMYEGGLRTPLVAYWPGKVPAGKTSDHLSAFWDMMPTSAELSGGTPARKHDGISMVPTLLGKTGDQKEHEYLYWELYERKAVQALRKGDWKAVVTDMRQPGKIELYNLARDPGEKTNLAPGHPELVAEMRTLMDQAHTPNPFWDKKNKSFFDVAAARQATGVPVPSNKKKTR